MYLTKPPQYTGLIKVAQNAGIPSNMCLVASLEKKVTLSYNQIGPFFSRVLFRGWFFIFFRKVHLKANVVPNHIKDKANNEHYK